MNNSHSAEEKIEQLAQRLQQTVMSRKQLEDTYTQDINLLSELIIKLTQASAGMDHELDNKLIKLRGLLQRNASMAELHDVISDAHGIIQQHVVNIQRQLKQTDEKTQLALGYLRRQPLVPKLRQQLAAIEQQLDAPSIAFTHYLPIVLQIIELLVQAGSITPTDSDNGDTSAATEKLLELLSQVDFDGSTGQLVQRIRQRLSKPLSSAQFTDLTLQLIQHIFNSINAERQSAQSFLLELNQTLGLVQGALQQTLEKRNQFHDQSGSLNQQLQSNMQQLGESVAAATQLNELKQQVNEHMLAINDALEQKLTLERDERRLFEQNYQKAATRMVHLERQVEQYKRQLAEQKFKSLQDALTKLPNRAAFEERLEVEFERWTRYKEPLCIAVADIDHFKRINDNYGHIAGDKTLQVIASMLRKSVKHSDFVSRYGGEEFVIIFPQTQMQQALERLQTVREKISQIPFKFKSEDIRITVSIGIAQFTQDSDTVVTVFEAADKALYEAKRRGRDQILSAS